MDETLSAVIRQLDLEPLEADLFRGGSRHSGTPSVFGGQVVAQALVAAERTVDGRVPHSLHAYFLFPGDVAAPIEYRVVRVRDGGSFSARRVEATQGARTIFTMTASFQAPEAGPEHAAPAPDVPPPESLPSFAELRERWLAEAAPVSPRLAEVLRAGRAFEFRPVEPQNPLRPVRREPRQAYWFRTVDPVPDDPRLHRALLAYASDTALAGTPLRPHGRAWPQVSLASIDHALWLHRGRGWTTGSSTRWTRRRRMTDAASRAASSSIAPGASSRASRRRCSSGRGGAPSRLLDDPTRACARAVDSLGTRAWRASSVRRVHAVREAGAGAGPGVGAGGSPRVSVVR